MGHSFHAGQEPFPRATQPLYLSVPETRKRLVPRSPISDPTEGILTIGAFLENSPPHQPRLPHRKWMSALPFSSPQGRKRSLDIFHRSSNPLKYLLRPRSEPPVPAPSGTIALQGSRSYNYSTERTGGLDLPRNSYDSSIINQGRKNKPLRMRQERDEETSKINHNRNFDAPRSTTIISNLQVSQHNGLEGDAFGIAKEYPHLISGSLTTPPSREEKGFTVSSNNGVFRSSDSNPRQRLGPYVYDSPSQYQEAQTMRTYTESGKGDGRRRTQPKPTFVTGAYNYTSASTDNQVNLRNWEKLPPEPSILSPRNDRSEPQRLTRITPLSMERNDTSLQTEQPPLQITVLSNERETLREVHPATPVRAYSPERAVSIKESTIPSPAPTTPLPPLPDRGICPRTTFRRALSPSQDQTEKPSSSENLSHAMRTQSPVRMEQEDQVKEAQKPERTKSKLRVHYKRQGMHNIPGDPKPGESSTCYDPFEQRRLRTEKTQALKKRHLQQLRAQQERERLDKEIQRAETEYSEETDDTIVLPSVEDIKRPQATTSDLDKSASHSGVGNWVIDAGSEQSQDATQTASIELQPPFEGKASESLPINRLGYRNQSMQYSPSLQTSYKSYQSPFLFPMPPTPPKPKSISSLQNLGCSVCANPVHRNRDSTLPDNRDFIPVQSHIQSSPKRLSWPLDELESRLETRLAIFERRTVLLEAALLAVIDAFANFGMGGKEGKREGGGEGGRRWSERTEISAALEGKLEDMIAGINGFGRG